VVTASIAVTSTTSPSTNRTRKGRPTEEKPRAAPLRCHWVQQDQPPHAGLGTVRAVFGAAWPGLTGESLRKPRGKAVEAV
jgi:hypothetical protein